MKVPAYERYQYKYYVVQIVKHSKELFAQSPEEEAASQEKMNTFIKRWHPDIEQVMAFHCYGLAADWDWIGIFGMDDLSSWVGFREELSRTFSSHIEKFLSLPAISHKEFVKATSNAPHYVELRKLGQYPGLAEIE